MECIAYYDTILPESASVLEGLLRYQLWPVQFWPYNLLAIGDIVYLYESQSNAIRWKTRIRMVEKFTYQNKGQARDHLVRLGGFDTRDPRFINSPEMGFCLAYRLKVLQKLDLGKPLEITFPRFGWLRLYEENVNSWLMPTAV